MKNKSIVLIMFLALLLTLTACGNSEFALSENDSKHMTITARNADRDAFFMVGSLDVADGEQIEIAANLTKGSVRVEIVGAAGVQDINELPETDGAAILTANLVRTDGASGTVPAGTYLLRATCLERATGTIEINVTPSENGGAEDRRESAGASETAEPEKAAETVSGPERRDGERFEALIILEGMEETVHYEYVRNDALGFGMDYDYENFVRRSEADREMFVSSWDDPDNPENYLELRYNPRDAETVAANICAFLSGEYEVRRDDAFALEGAGSCIRIDADEVKGGGYMPDLLQTVYVIPAGDGCGIAWERTFIVESEGFGRRFAYMLQSFSPLPARSERKLTDEQALTAVRNCCFIQNPGLAEIVKDGEYPDYWEVLSSDGGEIVVLYRSYTGAQNRYYIDPVSGETAVTELVPGILDEEQRTDESLNAWDYLF